MQWNRKDQIENNNSLPTTVHTIGREEAEVIGIEEHRIEKSSRDIFGPNVRSCSLNKYFCRASIIHRFLWSLH